LQTVTESKRAGAVLSTPTVSTYTYDPDTGNTLALTITSGASTLETTLYGYDPTRHWLTGVTNEDGSGNILSAFTYSRRADGQITQETESVRQPDGSTDTGTTTYKYDGLDRLTEEAYAGSLAGTSYTADYMMDLVGNRVSEAVTGAGAKSVMNTYNARDELTTAAITASGTTVTTVFEYDDNGSQTTISAGGVLQQTLVYDARNRLVEVDSGSGTVEESILYTADGARAAVTQNGVKTDYIVDGLSMTGYSEVLEEYQGGVLANSYVYGSSLLPIGQNTNTGGSILSSVLLLSDAHSGVRQAYQPGNGILLTQRFDAFGNATARVIAAGSPYTTSIGYRGERLDPILNQYYLRARIYNPSTGRFTSSDSFAGHLANPLSLHKYLYAAANPGNLSDPSGHDPFGAVEMLTVAGINAGLAATLTVAYGIAKGWSWQKIVGYSLLNAVIAFGATYAFFGIAYCWVLAGVPSATALSVTGIMITPAQLGYAIYNLDNAYKHGDDIDKEFAWIEFALALIAFRASRGTALSPDRVPITSWAERGVVPDLNTGRWVQIGRPTWWNYIKTGLIGGKFERVPDFPWFTWKSSNGSFNNFITGFIEHSKLVMPKELGIIVDFVKYLMGQRKIN
jgi:RHS repeat-associated protein